MNSTPHKAEAHHSYGPSSLKDRAICPGWVNDKSSDTTAADEGEMLHKRTETGDVTGLTDEQKDAVLTCIEYVAPLEKGAVAVLKEVRLSILGGLSFGTSDRVIYRVKKGKKHLDIVDFKFGRHSVDPAEKNLQGYSYLLGAFDLYPEAETADVHFLLPRRDEVDVCSFSRGDYDRLALAVRTVIERAMHYNASLDHSMLRPTAQGCLYCGRKVTCPKVTEFALGVAKKYAPLEIMEEVHSSAITSPGQMARLFDAAKVMEKFVESVKKHALDMALSTGGGLHDENGKLLYEIAEREGARKVKDLGLALPVLSKYLDDRALLSVSELSLSKALSLIGSSAPRGGKSKLIGQVEEELHDADALTQGNSSRYLRRVKE